MIFGDLNVRYTLEADIFTDITRMSAFIESGRSDRPILMSLRGSFRPIAEVQHRQFVNERAAQFAGETEPGLSKST